MFQVEPVFVAQNFKQFSASLKTSLDKTKEDKFIPKPNVAKTGEAGENLKQSIVVGHIRGREVT